MEDVRYAHTTLTLLDTPTKQCTRTFPLPLPLPLRSRPSPPSLVRRDSPSPSPSPSTAPATNRTARSRCTSKFSSSLSMTGIWRCLNGYGYGCGYGYVLEFGYTESDPSVVNEIDESERDDEAGPIGSVQTERTCVVPWRRGWGVGVRRDFAAARLKSVSVHGNDERRR
jgi:hypothetical protein